MKCEVISFQDYADGRDEGIAALKAANVRCQEAIDLLESNPNARFDTDEPEDIAWSIVIPNVIHCSQNENACQLDDLYFYMGRLI